MSRDCSNLCWPSAATPSPSNSGVQSWHSCLPAPQSSRNQVSVTAAQFHTLTDLGCPSFQLVTVRDDVPASADTASSSAAQARSWPFLTRTESYSAAADHSATLVSLRSAQGTRVDSSCASGDIIQVDAIKPLKNSSSHCGPDCAGMLPSAGSAPPATASKSHWLE